ncbi:MAG TPA: DUF983 domain-containing protein [Acidocella sp.]|nr:MAG: hypothetical protein B7Z77_03635 [Acidocella sp. 20-58-15]OYY05495.1 MAG: hypothetical protein B7Y73_01520 [Acidocella sp. 35-58-6]HQT38817.1 DUF983 domain-containing protein [Acidocella sp.]
MPAPSHRFTEAPDIWPPPGTGVPETDMPGWGTTIGRGIRGTCPRCAKAPIFNGYLKVHTVCASCGAPLGDMPSDDAPPYIAMLVVLHVLAFFVVMIFRYGWQPSPYEYGAMLLVLVAACMVGLRMAKGATIGILLKLGLKRAVLN